MKTIAERLAAAMLLSPDTRSQYGLAAKSGVPQPTILRILSGESNDPRKSTVKPLAEALNVSYQWLKEGVGLANNALIDAQNSALTSNNEHNNYNKNELSNAQSLDGLSLIKAPSRSFYYPEISEVMAGTPIEAIDLLQPGEGERHQSDAWAGTHGFWLRVKGDSMTRQNGVSFPEGMLILVAPQVEPRSGQFIVAKLDDSVTFKQYIEDAGVKFLKPLNTEYKQQEMRNEWQLVGTVVDAKWPKSIF